MDKKKLMASLKRLEERIGEKDFDLEVWKTAAVSHLARIFGPEHPKVKQLEAIKIDYSSWALRDAPASYHPLESCRRMGRELILSAIDEIEIFGVPEQNRMRDLLGSVYSEQEVDAIMGLAGKQEKEAELKKVLDKAGKEKSVQLILALLQSNPLS